MAHQVPGGNNVERSSLRTTKGRTERDSRAVKTFSRQSSISLPSGKRSHGWKITMFNRKYIDSIRGPHFPATAMLVDPGSCKCVKGDPSPAVDTK